MDGRRSGILPDDELVRFFVGKFTGKKGIAGYLTFGRNVAVFCLQVIQCEDSIDKKKRGSHNAM